MRNNNIRIGLIGCGKQATKHIASLRNIPGVELVLADIQRDLAEKLARKNGTEWADHPDEIMAEKTIRAIVVCTPTPSHVPLIKKAIAGSKDVFCEKPLSEDLHEVQELQEIVDQSGNVLMIGYIYRYVPVFDEGFRIFRKQQMDGESLVLGRSLSAFFRLGGRGSHQTWKHRKEEGGGAINEMLVHMIDLANWYFGPLHNLEVISNRLLHPRRVIQGEEVDVDAEDYIMVRCNGANGMEIFCQADLITPAFSQYVEIQGENGTFRGSIQTDSPSFVFLRESRGGYDSGKTELKFGQRNLLDIQMAAFIQAVNYSKLPDRNTLTDSLELMKVIEEIRAQIRGK